MRDPLYEKLSSLVCLFIASLWLKAAAGAYAPPARLFFF